MPLHKRTLLWYDAIIFCCNNHFSFSYPALLVPFVFHLCQPIFLGCHWENTHGSVCLGGRPPGTATWLHLNAIIDTVDGHRHPNCLTAPSELSGLIFKAWEMTIKKTPYVPLAPLRFCYCRKKKTISVLFHSQVTSASHGEWRVCKVFPLTFQSRM